MKYTKGPWKRNYNNLIRSISSDEAIGWIYSDHERADSPNQRTAKANARLIASSPELLEALEAILEQPGLYMHIDNRRKERARAAIAKAKGETRERGTCLNCGELVPEGCCTCGPRRRLE